MIDPDTLDRTIREALALPDSTDLKAISFAETPEWDSVGHLQLVNGIEKAFSISLDDDDVTQMGDYETIRRILGDKYGAGA